MTTIPFGAWAIIVLLVTFVIYVWWEEYKQEKEDERKLLEERPSLPTQAAYNVQQGVDRTKQIQQKPVPRKRTISAPLKQSITKAPAKTN